MINFILYNEWFQLFMWSFWFVSFWFVMSSGIFRNKIRDFILLISLLYCSINSMCDAVMYDMISFKIITYVLLVPIFSLTLWKFLNKDYATEEEEIQKIAMMIEYLKEEDERIENEETTNI